MELSEGVLKSALVEVSVKRLESMELMTPDRLRMSKRKKLTSIPTPSVTRTSQGNTSLYTAIHKFVSRMLLVQNRIVFVDADLLR